MHLQCAIIIHLFSFRLPTKQKREFRSCQWGKCLLSDFLSFTKGEGTTPSPMVLREAKLNNIVNMVHTWQPV